MNITHDIKYIGVNDHQVDLFEGQYVVPNGMSYNSYAILDEKVAIMDTVDANFTHEWLDNIQNTLGGRQPDYLIVQHMEPDHSANIANFMKVYPKATLVSSVKAFAMMQNFFGTDFADRRIVVGEGDTLSLGRHTLTFVTAPMVHWPEVIVTYDAADKVLFSADGFGKFGALDVDEDYFRGVKSISELKTAISNAFISEEYPECGFEIFIEDLGDISSYKCLMEKLDECGMEDISGIILMTDTDGDTREYRWYKYALSPYSCTSGRFERESNVSASREWYLNEEKILLSE